MKKTTPAGLIKYSGKTKAEAVKKALQAMAEQMGQIHVQEAIKTAKRGRK